MKMKDSYLIGILIAIAGPGILGGCLISTGAAHNISLALFILLLFVPVIIGSFLQMWASGLLGSFKIQSALRTQSAPKTQSAPRASQAESPKPRNPWEIDVPKVKKQEKKDKKIPKIWDDKTDGGVK